MSKPLNEKCAIGFGLLLVGVIVYMLVVGNTSGLSSYGY